MGKIEEVDKELKTLFEKRQISGCSSRSIYFSKLKQYKWINDESCRAYYDGHRDRDREFIIARETLKSRDEEIKKLEIQVKHLSESLNESYKYYR